MFFLCILKYENTLSVIWVAKWYGSALKFSLSDQIYSFEWNNCIPLCDLKNFVFVSNREPVAKPE
jgi:hypothetical protein